MHQQCRVDVSCTTWAFALSVVVARQSGESVKGRCVCLVRIAQIADQGRYAVGRCVTQRQTVLSQG
jgi:hypothetical protein